MTEAVLYCPLVAGRLTGGNPSDLFYTYLSLSLSFVLTLLVLTDFLLLRGLDLCMPLVKSLLASVGEPVNCTLMDLEKNRYFV